MRDRLVTETVVDGEVEEPPHHLDPRRIARHQPRVVGLGRLQALPLRESPNELPVRVEQLLLARSREPHLLEGLAGGVEIHEIEAAGRNSTEPPAAPRETDLTADRDFG